MIIEKIEALEVLDSRGNPTVEAIVILNDGSFSSAISPSGASTGTKEAFELRDKNPKRYGGKGVLQAVNNVSTTINSALCGLNALNQREIDSILKQLDGTENKSNLGANAILATSIAVAKAAASSLGISFYRYLGGTNAHKMPIPMMNILNGGKHADNRLAIQEFMIIPHAAGSFSEALRIGSEIFHCLKKHLSENNLSVGVGDEGGFAPNLSKSEEAISYILQAVEKAGYKPGADIYLALDCASSEFRNKDGLYEIDDLKLSSSELVKYYESLCKKYPIISIEDPFAEDDLEGFKQLTQTLGSTVQIVGDDLFCTNTKLIKHGIKNSIANAVLIKPNQIGTITETMDAILLAQKNLYNPIISHRSGESEDVSISHLAVATNAGQIKTGSLCRTDRIAKYNELLRIEFELKGRSNYSSDVFDRFLKK